MAESKSSYNDDMKREALLKRARKAHDWRVQVWAQSERRIKAINLELQMLGANTFEPFEPDFSSEEMLEHYATMKISG